MDPLNGPLEDSLPDFAGKLLSVICSNDTSGQLIYSPWFEKQAGRVFLVGTVPDNIPPEDWMQGLATCIAWDRIQDYVVFESVGDYQRRVQARIDSEDMN